jgi:peptidoglycan hydrolase CwlO-like protein
VRRGIVLDSLGVLMDWAPNTNPGSDALIDDRPPKNPRRSRIGWLVVLAGLVGLGVPTVVVAAQAISRQMESVRRLEAEIAGLDARYGQAAAAYDGARARLTTVRDRIQANTEALVRARVEFGKAQAQLAFRVSAVYRQPQPSGLELLLRSASLSEAMSRIDLLDRVQRQDGELVRTISASRERMRAARVQLIEDQKVAKQESQEARVRLSEVRSVRAARRGVLLSARRQLAVLITAEAKRQTDARRLAALRAAQGRVVQRTGGGPAPATGGGGGDISAALGRIALCESGGNPTAVSPSGLYRGKYQFDPQTWQRLGGTGDPAQAPEAEQDRIAGILYGQGGPASWPVCGR